MENQDNGDGLLFDSVFILAPTSAHLTDCEDRDGSQGCLELPKNEMK